jgi:hypothetical protein
MKYRVGLKVFDTYAEANAYFDMMFKISGIILGIEEVK